jgi:hypothetical protein
MGAAKGPSQLVPRLFRCWSRRATCPMAGCPRERRPVRGHRRPAARCCRRSDRSRRATPPRGEHRSAIARPPAAHAPSSPSAPRDRHAIGRRGRARPTAGTGSMPSAASSWCRRRWAHDGRRVQPIPSHTYSGGLIRVSPLPRSLLLLRNEQDYRAASRHHSRRAIARLALFTGAHPASCSHGDMPTRKQWPSFPAGRGRPWPAVGSLPLGRKVPDPSWRSYSSVPSAIAGRHSG